MVAVENLGAGAKAKGFSLEAARQWALFYCRACDSTCCRRRGEALAQVEGPKVRSGVSARPARPPEAPAAGALVPTGG